MARRLDVLRDPLPSFRAAAREFRLLMAESRAAWKAPRREPRRQPPSAQHRGAPRLLVDLYLAAQSRAVLSYRVRRKFRRSLVQEIARHHRKAA